MISKKNNKTVDKMSCRAMILIIAFALFFTAGCREERLSYAEFAEIGSEGWDVKDAKCFDIQPIDSTDLVSGRHDFDVMLIIRHTSDYAYENIWLETTMNPDPTVEPDTLELKLTDRMGKWLGKGYGGVYEISDTLYRGVAFSDLQKIKIRHIMTDSLLKGVNNVGIIVIKPKK